MLSLPSPYPPKRGENAGGDLWFNDDGALNANVGTVNCAVYSFYGGTCGEESGANISLGTVDFKWDYFVDGDVNGDGEANVLDAVYMRNILVGKLTAIAADTFRAENSSLGGINLTGLLTLKNMLINAQLFPFRLWILPGAEKNYISKQKPVITPKR